MARIVALAHSAHLPAPSRLAEAEVLRSVIVCACALALILAKSALPF